MKWEFFSQFFLFFIFCFYFRKNTLRKSNKRKNYIIINRFQQNLKIYITENIYFFKLFKKKKKKLYFYFNFSRSIFFFIISGILRYISYLKVVFRDLWWYHSLGCFLRRDGLVVTLTYLHVICNKENKKKIIVSHHDKINKITNTIYVTRIY